MMANGMMVIAMVKENMYEKQVKENTAVMMDNELKMLLKGMALLWIKMVESILVAEKRVSERGQACKYGRMDLFAKAFSMRTKWMR